MILYGMIKLGEWEEVNPKMDIILNKLGVYSSNEDVIAVEIEEEETFGGIGKGVTGIYLRCKKVGRAILTADYYYNNKHYIVQAEYPVIAQENSSSSQIIESSNENKDNKQNYNTNLNNSNNQSSSNTQSSSNNQSSSNSQSSSNNQSSSNSKSDLNIQNKFNTQKNSSTNNNEVKGNDEQEENKSIGTDILNTVNKENENISTNNYNDELIRKYYK